MLRNILNRKVLVTVILTLLVFFTANAEGWDVPDDQKAKNSYIKFDATARSQGEVLYNSNCASCHGNPTQNNVLKSLNPIPPDLGSKQAQDLTDGELQYILSIGRGLMPSFKNVMSEENRWKVISYIRGFNKEYVQELSKFDPTKIELVKLTVSYDSIAKKINIEAIAEEKSGAIKLKNSEISLFVKRYFGNLQIDKTTATDENGLVSFEFPTDIPGDKTGDLEVIIKFFDQNYGEVQTSSKLKIGVPTDVPPLTDQRAIWNVVSKAPLWIIFLYSLGVIGFGILVLYLLNNLRKLYNSGKE